MQQLHMAGTAGHVVVAAAGLCNRLLCSVPLGTLSQAAAPHSLPPPCIDRRPGRSSARSLRSRASASSAPRRLVHTVTAVPLPAVLCVGTSWCCAH